MADTLVTRLVAQDDASAVVRAHVDLLKQAAAAGGALGQSAAAASNQAVPAHQQHTAAVTSTMHAYLSLGSVVGNLPGPLGGVERAFGAVHVRLTDVQAVMLGVGAAATGMGLSLEGSLRGAVAASMEFERVMSSVRAILPVAETQAYGAALSDLALRLSRDSVFGAQELAEGLANLARSGQSSRAILDGLAQATVNMAGAMGTEPKVAALALGAAMREFNLAASDANRIADLFSQAVHVSGLSADGLSTAMGRVGPIVRAAGGDITDAVTGIELLTRSGISAQRAGTELAQLYEDVLAPRTAAAGAEMKRLGIITADGTNQFVTADGRVKSFVEIAKVLGETLGHLTPVEEAHSAQIIFSRRAMEGALIAANAYKTGGLDQLLDAQHNARTAAEAMAERLNNLWGASKQLTSSIQTLSVQFGGALTPAVLPAVQAATAFTNALINLDPQVKTTVAGVIAVEGAVLTAAGAWTTLRVAVPLVQAAWAPATGATAANTAANLENAAATTAAAAAQGRLALATGGAAAAGAAPAVGGLVNAAGVPLASTLAGAGATAATGAGGAAAATGGAGLAGSLLAGGVIAAAFAALTVAVVNNFLGLQDLVKANMGTLGQMISGVGNTPGAIAAVAGNVSNPDLATNAQGLGGLGAFANRQAFMSRLGDVRGQQAAAASVGEQYAAEQAGIVTDRLVAEIIDRAKAGAPEVQAEMDVLWRHVQMDPATRDMTSGQFQELYNQVLQRIREFEPDFQRAADDTGRTMSVAWDKHLDEILAKAEATGKNIPQALEKAKAGLTEGWQVEQVNAVVGAFKQVDDIIKVVGGADSAALEQRLSSLGSAQEVFFVLADAAKQLGLSMDTVQAAAAGNQLAMYNYRQALEGTQMAVHTSIADYSTLKSALGIDSYVNSNIQALARYNPALAGTIEFQVKAAESGDRLARLGEGLGISTDILQRAMQGEAVAVAYVNAKVEEAATGHMKYSTVLGLLTGSYDAAAVAEGRYQQQISQEAGQLLPALDQATQAQVAALKNAGYEMQAAQLVGSKYGLTLDEMAKAAQGDYDAQVKRAAGLVQIDQQQGKVVQSGRDYQALMDLLKQSTDAGQVAAGLYNDQLQKVNSQALAGMDLATRASTQALINQHDEFDAARQIAAYYGVAITTVTGALGGQRLQEVALTDAVQRKNNALKESEDQYRRLSGIAPAADTSYKGAVEATIKAYRDLGIALPRGMAQGVSTAAPVVSQAVSDMLTSAEATVRDQWQIASPSQWWAARGTDAVLGLQGGFLDAIPGFQTSVTNALGAVGTAGSGALADTLGQARGGTGPVPGPTYGPGAPATGIHPAGGTTSATTIDPRTNIATTVETSTAFSGGGANLSSYRAPAGFSLEAARQYMQSLGQDTRALDPQMVQEVQSAITRRVNQRTGEVLQTLIGADQVTNVPGETRITYRPETTQEIINRLQPAPGRYMPYPADALARSQFAQLTGLPQGYMPPTPALSPSDLIALQHPTVDYSGAPAWARPQPLPTPPALDPEVEAARQAQFQAYQEASAQRLAERQALRDSGQALADFQSRVGSLDADLGLYGVATGRATAAVDQWQPRVTGAAGALESLGQSTTQTLEGFQATSAALDTTTAAASDFTTRGLGTLTTSATTLGGTFLTMEQRGQLLMASQGKYIDEFGRLQSRLVDVTEAARAAARAESEFGVSGGAQNFRSVVAPALAESAAEAFSNLFAARGGTGVMPTTMANALWMMGPGAAVNPNTGILEAPGQAMSLQMLLQSGLASHGSQLAYRGSPTQKMLQDLYGIPAGTISTQQFNDMVAQNQYAASQALGPQTAPSALGYYQSQMAAFNQQRGAGNAPQPQQAGISGSGFAQAPLSFAIVNGTTTDQLVRGQGGLSDIAASVAQSNAMTQAEAKALANNVSLAQLSWSSIADISHQAAGSIAGIPQAFSAIPLDLNSKLLSSITGAWTQATLGGPSGPIATGPGSGTFTASGNTYGGQAFSALQALAAQVAAEHPDLSADAQAGILQQQMRTNAAYIAVVGQTTETTGDLKRRQAELTDRVYALQSAADQLGSSYAAGIGVMDQLNAAQAELAGVVAQAAGSVSASSLAGPNPGYINPLSQGQPMPTKPPEGAGSGHWVVGANGQGWAWLPDPVGGGTMPGAITGGIGSNNIPAPPSSTPPTTTTPATGGPVRIATVGGMDVYRMPDGSQVRVPAGSPPPGTPPVPVSTGIYPFGQPPGGIDATTFGKLQQGAQSGITVPAYVPGTAGPDWGVAQGNAGGPLVPAAGGDNVTNHVTIPITIDARGQGGDVIDAGVLVKRMLEELGRQGIKLRAS